MKANNTDLKDKLSYSGLVLLVFELLKKLIVNPIKSFYLRTTFSENSVFKTYENDVKSRDNNELDACLKYLKDFMEAINDDDYKTIQEIRIRRNQIAHDLTEILKSFDYKEFSNLLNKAKQVLFKISNYRTKMEIGADPEFQKMNIDWETITGQEYVIFSDLLNEIQEKGERLTTAST